jgi:hypothetical protein
MSEITIDILGNPESFNQAIVDFVNNSTSHYQGQRYESVVSSKDLTNQSRSSFTYEGMFYSRTYKHSVQSEGCKIMRLNANHTILADGYGSVRPQTFFWAEVLQKSEAENNTFVAYKTKYLGLNNLEYHLLTNDPFFQGNFHFLEWKEVEKTELPHPNLEQVTDKPIVVVPAEKLTPQQLSALVEEKYAAMIGDRFRGAVYLYQNSRFYLNYNGEFDPSGTTRFNKNQDSDRFYLEITDKSVTEFPLPDGTLIGACLWTAGEGDKYLAAKIKFTTKTWKYSADLYSNDRDWVKKRKFESWEKIS